MGYRFRPGDLNAAAVSRIAAEQFARAKSELAHEPIGALEVHECRKVVKRLRSLLKLVEPELTAKFFSARYKALGALGRMLAGARDRHVLETTIAKLEERYGGNAARVLEPFKAHLQRGKPDSDTHVARADGDRIIEAFAHEAKKFARMTMKARGFAAIESGLARTYETARRDFEKAYRHPSDHRFHELRKAVQWHWRHMALLSRAWPDYFAGRIAACRELAEDLGDDHDLAVLIEEVQRSGDVLQGDRAAMVLLAKSRQQELRTKAFALAERLFAESPKAFLRRMKAYWKARRVIGIPAGAGAEDGARHNAPPDDHGPADTAGMSEDVRIRSAPRLAMKSRNPSPARK